MKNNLKFALGASMLVFLGFGCGQSAVENAAERQIESSGQTNANVDIGANGQVAIETDQGSYYSGGQLPKNWPTDLPIMPSAQVQMAGNSTQAGGAGSGAVFMIHKTPSEVAEYYKTELTKNGYTISDRAEAMGIFTLVAKKGQSTVSLAAQSTGEQTTVTIGIDQQ